MRTSVSRLNTDVGKIGGPNDTIDLRKKVQDAIATIQKEASSIKDELFGVVPDQKNRQSAKLVSDFEVKYFSDLNWKKRLLDIFLYRTSMYRQQSGLKKGNFVCTSKIFRIASKIL